MRLCIRYFPTGDEQNLAAFLKFGLDTTEKFRRFVGGHGIGP